MPKSRKLLAVPFVGKDVPSRASEFSHPDVVIGKTREEMLKCLERVAAVLRASFTLCGSASMGQAGCATVAAAEISDDVCVCAALKVLFAVTLLRGVFDFDWWVDAVTGTATCYYSRRHVAQLLLTWKARLVMVLRLTTQPSTRSFFA